MTKKVEFHANQDFFRTVALQFQDNINLIFGTGGDATIDYDGSNLHIKAQVVGTGSLEITGGDDSSGTSILRGYNSSGILRFQLRGDGFVKVFGPITLFITDTDGTTEGEIWYDASEDKLKFKTAAGVETITST